jgi:hypothetical protein
MQPSNSRSIPLNSPFFNKYTIYQAAREMTTFPLLANTLRFRLTELGRKDREDIIPTIPAFGGDGT